MARKIRLFIPGAVYHVFCRITRGEMVFKQKEEAERLIAEVQRVRQRDNLVIYGYCVMSNHYHLSLRTAEVPLWRTMASLQGRVARAYNRCRGIRGSLWQSRYKARIVESQEYFEQLLAYIHLNPVSARIVDDPVEYRWSGHRELLGLQRPLLVDVDEALVSFGPTRGEAREQYLAYLRCCSPKGWVRGDVRHLPWWARVSDNEELVAPRPGVTYEDFLGERIVLDRPRVPVEMLVALCSHYLGVDQKRLSSRGRTASDREARIITTALSVERYGHKVAQVASALMKNPGSVSRWLAQAQTRRIRDESFDQQLDALDLYIRERATGGCESRGTKPEERSEP